MGIPEAALAADLTVTVGGILRWNRQLDAMEKIAADLRELSGKMGENIYENVMDTMELREKVDAAVEEKRQQLAEQRQLLAETKEQAAELRRKYKELAERSLRTGRHMLRAFPKLQSRRHKEILEQIRERIRTEGRH